MKITMEKIDLKTGAKKVFEATIVSNPDSTHKIYSLLYEGYRSEWQEQEEC